MFPSRPVSQNASGPLEGLDEGRDDLSALLLVEGDDLLADDGQVVAGEAELLVHLLVRGRRTPCRKTILLVAVLLPPEGL